MSGSVLGPTVVVGEAEVVGLAVDDGDEVGALDEDESGLASPPHPASNNDAANGTANTPARYLFTVPPTVTTS